MKKHMDRWISFVGDGSKKRKANGMQFSHFFYIFLLALSLVGFSFLGFSYHSWHQKMTVEVEVDGQVYSGSSVVEMTVFGHPDIPLVHGNRDLSMRGEAVVMELPGNQFLFALLTYNAYLAAQVFKDRMDGSLSESGERWAEVISDLRATRVMEPEQYPLLVTFTDITDPTTVQKVDPDNLGAMFGPGVSLKRITLEITEEPVTEGRIEHVLGWWLAQGTDLRDPPPFYVPNNSPRGYETVGITKFIMKSH